jgi:hypothetical protein
MNKLEQKVIKAFKENASTQTNNDICWAEIIISMGSDLFLDEEMLVIEKLLSKIITRELPSQHSVVASISNVRSKHAEWRLTDEEKEMKKEQRNNWIELRKEYLGQ